jgi:CRP-like cAMP-binding protein
MIKQEPALDMLKASVTRFISLTDEECKNLSQIFYPVHLKKREVWLTPGEHCTSIGFIVKGCVRSYYVKEQQENTAQFFFEGDWSTDYGSWLTREPSFIGIEAIEPAELLVIPFHRLEKLYDECPKFERLGRIMAENTIIKIRKRNMSLLNDKPEEAYLKLLEERPNVIARVPQHFIASFLGIEPESLSRIRKKLSRKGPALVS